MWNGCLFRFGDEGARYFCKGMEGNITLLSVSMCYCDLGVESGDILGKMLVKTAVRYCFVQFTLNYIYVYNRHLVMNWTKKTKISPVICISHVSNFCKKSGCFLFLFNSSGMRWHANEKKCLFFFPLLIFLFFFFERNLYFCVKKLSWLNW